MRSGLFVAGVSCVCFAWGCGSNDSPSGGGTSGMSAGGSAGSTHAGTDAGGSTGTSGSASHAGASGTGGSSGASSAGSSGDEPMSEACKTYCTCHDKNCATYPIPDGKSCAAFCAGMTDDQLACRQNMCKLVPDQPDNDHCTHSLGIVQCL